MALVLEHVSKSFGGLRAVGDVGFTVPDKVVFGLIGPNGAGKTTVFNLVTGVYKPDGGSIRFGSVDLAALSPAQIAGAGIGRTFQNIRLFSQLTVLENLLVACELQKKAHLAAAILRLRSHYEDEASMEQRARELLRVFDLDKVAEEAPTSLSYGNQRRLEIARAMMLAPKVLLLDEPAAGMNYGEAEGLKTQIRWLRDTFAVSIVLVEHNMQVVMGVCEEIHVLDHGETIAHGTPAEVRKNAKVLAAYLGEDDDRAPSLRAVVAAAAQDLSSELPSFVESTHDLDSGIDPEATLDPFNVETRVSQLPSALVRAAMDVLPPDTPVRQASPAARPEAPATPATGTRTVDLPARAEEEGGLDISRAELREELARRLAGVAEPTSLPAWPEAAPAQDVGPEQEAPHVPVPSEAAVSTTAPWPGVSADLAEAALRTPTDSNVAELALVEPPPEPPRARADTPPGPPVELGATAPADVTSTPDVAQLDDAWGSDGDLGVHDDPDASEEASR